MLTRSRTKAARVEAAAAAAQPLDSLASQPPEILNLIGDALAADEDALEPRHLGALSRSCKVVKAAVKDSLAKVKVEHEAARALIDKCGDTLERIVVCHQWRRPTKLHWHNKGLTAADAPALVSVLKSKALVQAEWLNLNSNNLGDEGAAAIAAAAAAGGLPRLRNLVLDRIQIGVAGMQALATAFADGAFRELERLYLYYNEIGDAGLAAFVAALEKGALPALDHLFLDGNIIGDEGLKALMAAAGGGRLAKLNMLFLRENEFGEETVEALAVSIANGNLPSLKELWVNDEGANNPRLIAACAERGIRLNEDEDSSEDDGE